MVITREAFAEWMQYVLYHRYINVDGAHGAQCWDLFGHFCDWFGFPRVNTHGGRWSGWAGALVDQYAVNGAAANFDLISPEQPAQMADTAVWGDSYWYYPKTHVAQVYADAGNLLLCLSQNSSTELADNPYPGASTGPTILQHLPKQGLIGYLRPRSGISYQGSVAATPTEAGFLMALSDQDQDNIYQAISRIDAWIKSEKADVVGPIVSGVLFGNRVEGRNIVDTGRQGLANDAAILAAISGIKGGSVTATDIANAIPGDIAQQVVDALAERLGGK